MPFFIIKKFKWEASLLFYCKIILCYIIRQIDYILGCLLLFGVLRSLLKQPNGWAAPGILICICGFLSFCRLYLICVWWSLINGFAFLGLLIFRYMGLSLWSVSWLSESLICGEKLIALHHTSREKPHRCKLENRPQAACNGANFGETDLIDSMKILGKI